jgi:hypothetical protein
MAVSTPSPLTSPRPTGGIYFIERQVLPLAAGVSAQKGGYFSCWASGYYGPAGQSGSPGTETPPLGRFSDTVSNVGGINGAASCNCEYLQGRWGMRFDNDATNPVTITNNERLCSLVDDHTVCAPGTVLSTGQVATDAGLVIGFEPQGTTGGSSSTGIYVERLFGSSTDFDEDEATPPGTSFVARAVANANLPAYTGTTTGTLTASANGALAAQDGVTMAVGDILLLTVASTNLTALSDAGLYQITSLGASGAKYVLQRVPGWTTGNAIPNGRDVNVSEGTLFAGTSWRVFAVKGQIVDTNDPVLYPRQVTIQVTMNGASPSLFAITTIPLRSVTKSNAIAMYAGGGTPAATTLAYQPGVITPASLGSAGSVTISAVKAQMAGVNTDTALVNVTITN